MPEQLVFLCGARDFHAMDWYKSAKRLMPQRDIFILTDLLRGEGFIKLVNEQDIVFNLLIIDNILLKKQSHFGNIWRNAIKLIVFPIQVYLIKRFAKKHPDAIYHAHSMYYLTLAWASRIPFLGTPQGSDILIKPFISRIYRYFSVKSLNAAKAITVDSVKMKETIFQLIGKEAHVIQNGIDLETIHNFNISKSNNTSSRVNLLSVRGMTPLYRIKEIVATRNSSDILTLTPIKLIYPFYEKDYKNEACSLLRHHDVDLGRIDRNRMYELLIETKLVISIPISDSSPRSVYEAVFCGCAVAATYHPYYDVLPHCMKSRIILVDIADKNWLDLAVEKSNEIINLPFYPSDEALEMFDQLKSFKKVEALLFN